MDNPIESFVFNEEDFLEFHKSILALHDKSEKTIFLSILEAPFCPLRGGGELRRFSCFHPEDLQRDETGTKQGRKQGRMRRNRDGTAEAPVKETRDETGRISLGFVPFRRLPGPRCVHTVRPECCPPSVHGCSITRMEEAVRLLQMLYDYSNPPTRLKNYDAYMDALQRTREFLREYRGES